MQDNERWKVPLQCLARSIQEEMNQVELPAGLIDSAASGLAQKQPHCSYQKLGFVYIVIKIFMNS